MAGGLYSPSAGDVLTAANAIDYWSKQVVIICTSGTRPASPRSGMTCWQTDTLTYIVYGTAWCEVTPYSATVATSQTTTSTSYTDLATSGPAVTVTTGTKILVTLHAWIAANSALTLNYMSYAVSGATTVAASDTYAALVCNSAANAAATTDGARTVQQGSLTAGANTVTAKYRVNGNTGTFVSRDITAVGIPT